MNSLLKHLHTKIILKKIQRAIKKEDIFSLLSYIGKIASTDNAETILNLQNYFIEQNNAFASLQLSHYAHKYVDLKKTEEIILKEGTANDLSSYLEYTTKVYDIESIYNKVLEFNNPALCLKVLNTDLPIQKEPLLKIIFEKGNAQQVFKCFTLKNINESRVLEALLTKTNNYQEICNYLSISLNPNYEKIENSFLVSHQYKTYIKFLSQNRLFNKEEIIKKITPKEIPELNIAFAEYYYNQLTSDNIDKIINTVVDSPNPQHPIQLLNMLFLKLNRSQKELLEFAIAITSHTQQFNFLEKEDNQLAK